MNTPAFPRCILPKDPAETVSQTRKGAAVCRSFFAGYYCWLFDVSRGKNFQVFAAMSDNNFFEFFRISKMNALLLSWIRNVRLNIDRFFLNALLKLLHQLRIISSH